jgi:hypothetical protein
MNPGTRIEDMDFIHPSWGQRMSTRIKNALLRGGIMTLADLRAAEEMPEGIGVVGKTIIAIKLSEIEDE